MLELIKFFIGKYKANKEDRRLRTLTYSQDRHKVYGLGTPLRKE